MQSVGVFLWLISFCIIFKVQLCYNMYQYFILSYCWIVFYYMNLPHFVFHLAVDGHLDCFHFLAVMNMLLWIFACEIFVCIHFHFSWGILRSGIAVSYDNPMFNFLRNCQIVFQRSCSIYNHTKNIWEFQCSTSFITCACFIIVILVYVKWYLIVVLICILLITNDIKHISICLLAICVSPWQKYLLKSLSILSILNLDYLSFYCWLVIIPYKFWKKCFIRYALQIFFYHSMSYFFYFLIDSFEEWMFYIFRKSNVFFPLGVFVSGFIPKKLLSNTISWRFNPIVSSKSFIVLAL